MITSKADTKRNCNVGDDLQELQRHPFREKKGKSSVWGFTDRHHDICWGYKA